VSPNRSPHLERLAATLAKLDSLSTEMMSLADNYESDALDERKADRVIDQPSPSRASEILASAREALGQLSPNHAERVASPKFSSRMPSSLPDEMDVQPEPEPAVGPEPEPAVSQEESESTREQLCLDSTATLLASADNQSRELSRLESLRGELHSTQDALTQAQIQIRMMTLDHEQELRKVQFEHDMACNRMTWEHEERTNSQEYAYQQTIKAISPECERLQKELEGCTARLIQLQDDKRELAKAVVQQKAINQAELTLAREHYNHVLQKVQDSIKSSESAASPVDTSCRCNVCMDAPVSRVFACGHAKCSDCADRLIGLGRGCPDCRAPLDEPRLLFLNVG